MYVFLYPHMYFNVVYVSQDVADKILNKYGRLDLYINTVGILHNSDGMQPGMILHGHS